MRSRYDGLDLLEGHLRVVAAAALVEHAAGGHDLDQIIAQLVVQAHRLDRVIDAIDDALRYARIPGEVAPIAVGRIGVPSGGADGLSCREDAWAR
jgi:hypothetical protein